MTSAEGKLLALPVTPLAWLRGFVHARLSDYLEGGPPLRPTGLAVFALAAAVIGPTRDYWIAAMFPDWIAFSPGIAPVLAVATIYALLVVVGHAVMRLVAGPAQGDSFARWLSGAGKNNAASRLKHGPARVLRPTSMSRVDRK